MTIRQSAIEINRLMERLLPGAEQMNVGSGDNCGDGERIETGLAKIARNLEIYLRQRDEKQ